GEDQDARGRGLLYDLPGAFDAVEQRHRDIHHNDVRTEGRRELYGLTAGLGFAGDFDIGFGFEQRAQSLPDDGVIVGQQYSDLGHVFRPRAKNSTRSFAGADTGLNGISTTMVVP